MKHNEKLKVIEKFSGNVISEIQLSGEKEIDKAVIDAQNIRQQLIDIPRFRKSDILRNIAENIKKNRIEIASLIASEAAKPLRFALIETDRAVQTFLIASEEVNKEYGEICPVDVFPGGENKEAVIRYFPVGVVFGITPFNFPINLVAHKIAPAIAASCPILLKPSFLTPLTALKLEKIILETDLPSGAVKVLPMERNLADKLVADSRIQKISFTGSPFVGWSLKQKCGNKRITLELGGNAGAIVSESADLLQAVNKCVSGAFAYSGQVCIHTQRIYVHESNYSRFIEMFMQKMSTLNYGNPVQLDTDISVVISEEEAVRIKEWIDEAIRKGAICLNGGMRSGSYIEPTLLTNTSSDMKVWKDEIFGPVVLIEKYAKFEDAVHYVNDSIFGLQAGVFTNNLEEINYAFRNIDCGAVLINEAPTFRADHLPYGGIKNSGFGREGVKYAMREMSEIKVLVKPV